MSRLPERHVAAGLLTSERALFTVRARMPVESGKVYKPATASRFHACKRLVANLAAYVSSQLRLTRKFCEAAALCVSAHEASIGRRLGHVGLRRAYHVDHVVVFAHVSSPGVGVPILPAAVLASIQPLAAMGPGMHGEIRLLRKGLLAERIRAAELALTRVRGHVQAKVRRSIKPREARGACVLSSSPSLPSARLGLPSARLGTARVAIGGHAVGVVLVAFDRFLSWH